MKDLNRVKELLINSNDTCVLCKGERVYRSDLRGVKPLVMWLESGEDFKGFSAADKVVGKGAAFLYVLLQVEKLYANVISESALCVLRKHNIEVQYSTLVENIINRRGDGICPFEEAVLDIDDKDEAFSAIKAKMTELNITL